MVMFDTQAQMFHTKMLEKFWLPFLLRQLMLNSRSVNMHMKVSEPFLCHASFYNRLLFDNFLAQTAKSCFDPFLRLAKLAVCSIARIIDFCTRIFSDTLCPFEGNLRIHKELCAMNTV